MMKKFTFLLLDSDVVIELWRLGLWDRLTEVCGIHVGRTVVGEAHFYLDEHGTRQDFDLAPYEHTGKITVFDVSIADLDAFRLQFSPIYFEKLDPGETESLAFMLKSREEYLLCSADKIIYRILGALSRSEQGISLEEVLLGVGLGRPLARQFSKLYRQQWTRKGFEEGLQGIARRK